MRRIALHDESPTRQDQQIADLGGDLYPGSETDETDAESLEELAFGADPFEIIARREELRLDLEDTLSSAISRRRTR